MNYLKKIGLNSKKASKNLSNCNPKKINSVLKEFSKLLQSNKNQIIRQNKKDLKKAKRKNLIDRLMLNEERINSMIFTINQIIKLKNPIGKVLEKWKRPNGLIIKKVSTPIGVVSVIYESRPNVTADVSAICLKSGNAVILRGGSDAFFSNKILVKLFKLALAKYNFDKNCIQFIEKKDKKVVDYLLSKMSESIDVIVPRGGKNLVSKVKKFSKVHVIGHLEGLCHIYVDKNSSVNMAKKIVLNSKMRRTGICGAAETLLLHKDCLKTHGVPIIKELMNAGCSILVDKTINSVFQNKLRLANEKDWRTEYLDSKISVKSVSNVGEAINHISKYGTFHTDSIITNNKKTAQIFLSKINSSIAVHNASTQFADGGEFGFGGEIGISTNKLPPRGPVGINQLTSYKYIVIGKGTIRP
tara:strand:- start:634 stop:1875 length:1242 start_codon:yes stop_codon:yes gene_type:complete